MESTQRMATQHTQSRLGGFVRRWFGHRELITQMTKREIAGRYRGSYAGVVWSLLTPVFMLLVYTFVFSVVFKARWGAQSGEEAKGMFAVVLFSGMIVHAFFSEVITRASMQIVGHSNFVKKVVFPLEILPVVCVNSALFNMLISLAVLIVAIFILAPAVHWTMLYFPLVIWPFVIFALGCAWILASLGVFVRDIGQVTAMLSMVLMFLSPIFYPVTAVPESFQFWMQLNPLTFIVEEVRKVMIWGSSPDWAGWAIYMAAAHSFALVAYFWFQKTKKGFADVL